MLEPPVVTPKPPPASDIGLHWAMLTLCSMVIVASFVLRIEGSTRVMLPCTNIALPGLCWFRRLLNIDCPGCGLTRSFISLSHGRLADAWFYNPAAPLLYALVVSQVPYHVAQLWRARGGLRAWQLGKAGTMIPLFIVGALFAQWLVRLCLWL